MTTILYDHDSQVVTVDGLCTRGDYIVSHEYKKWKYVDGAIFFFCGAVADIEKFLCAKDGPVSTETLEVTAIMVTPDRQAFMCSVYEGKYWKSPLLCSEAIGSGADFAIAALDHGATAEEAVKYASFRDTGTGGKIYLFDIAEFEFKLR